MTAVAAAAAEDEVKPYTAAFAGACCNTMFDPNAAPNENGMGFATALATVADEPSSSTDSTNRSIPKIY